MSSLIYENNHMTIYFDNETERYDIDVNEDEHQEAFFWMHNDLVNSRAAIQDLESDRKDHLSRIKELEAQLRAALSIDAMVADLKDILS